MNNTLWSVTSKDVSKEVTTLMLAVLSHELNNSNCICGAKLRGSPSCMRRSCGTLLTVGGFSHLTCQQRSNGSSPSHGPTYGACNLGLHRLKSVIKSAEFAALCCTAKVDFKKVNAETGG